MKVEIKSGLSRWNDFSGRSSRREYWWFTAFFLALPIVLQLPLWAVIFIFAPGPGAVIPFIALAYAWVILIPAQISNNVRRLHDVGKSGWLMLVPIYSFYLYVQPSKEDGRLPFWVVVEKTALAFVFLSLLGILGGNTVAASTGASIFWLVIYLTIRWFNGKEKRRVLETP